MGEGQLQVAQFRVSLHWIPPHQAPATEVEASTLLATTILNRLICKYSKVCTGSSNPHLTHTHTNRAGVLI